MSTTMSNGVPCPIPLYTVPDVGRYDWNWILETVDFTPKGKRSITDSRHPRGAGEKAARRAALRMETDRIEGTKS